MLLSVKLLCGDAVNSSIDSIERYAMILHTEHDYYNQRSVSITIYKFKSPNKFILSKTRFA